MDWPAYLALALLLAGCAQAPGDAPPQSVQWEPLACDASGATTIGANAPPAPGLRGPDAAVAQRVAQAFGDSLNSTQPTQTHHGSQTPEDSFARWATGTGHVQVTRAYGSVTWEVVTHRGAYPTMERLVDGLVELGVPAGSLVRAPETQRMVNQAWRDQALHGARAWFLPGEGDPAPMGRYGSFHLGEFIVPPAQLDELPDAQLLASARPFLRCTLDAAGFTEAAGYTETHSDLGPYAAVNGALARHVHIQYTEPEESHCGFWQVAAVDVVTGAVLAPVVVGCD